MRMGSDGFDSGRWRRIEQVLNTAFDLAPEEVGAFLDRACEGDSRLRAEVEELLAADIRAEGFLETPAFALDPGILEAPTEPVEEEDGQDPLGRRVGPWRLVGRLGRGGMGSVYRAERADGAFEQQVALKLVKRGLDSEEILARFRQERRILARLEHPNIARLVDGGLTEEGAPYFAMEYVEGESITAYCSQHARTLEDVLRLFTQVCVAVQYAHQNLVVHRDLKPGNILATADGTVKLLDFGIAKLLDPTASGERTTLDERRLTPHYAAPEHLRGDLPTTAMDVYSLGVVLYELLTGLKPHGLAGETPRAVERAILETEPRPPSIALAARGRPEATLKAAIEPRMTSWVPRLRGDLDNIVMMALRKEPDERYPSVGALREDVDRFLVGRPVAATPPTWSYRARRFVRRNRVAAIAGLAAVLSLIAGLAGVMWQTERAREEARRAGETRDFLAGLFEAADPNVAKGDTLTARALLDQGADRLARDLEGQPALQAEMAHLLGGIYRQIGTDPRAQAMFERAAALRRRAFGANSPEEAASLVQLGAVLTDRAVYDSAETVLEHARDVIERRRGRRHPDLAEALRKLAVLSGHTGHEARAESLYNQALAIDEAAYGPMHPKVAEDLDDFGTLEFDMRRLDRAAPLYQRALTIRLEALGREHIATAQSMQNVAAAIAGMGQVKRADSLNVEALAVFRKLLGPDDVRVATTLSNYAVGFFRPGTYDRADSMMAEARRIYLLRLGPDHPETGRATNNLGAFRMWRWRYAEAETLFRLAAAAWSRSLGKDHYNTLLAEAHIAAAVGGQRREAEAERLFRDVLERVRRVLGDEHPVTAFTYNDWGVFELRRGHYAAAVPLLRHALAIWRKSAGGTRAQLDKTIEKLGLALAEQGQVEEAQRLLEEIPGVTSVPGDSSGLVAVAARIALGRALTRIGAYPRAEQLLRHAAAVRERLFGANSPEATEARLALALCLARAGKDSEASSLLAGSLAASEHSPLYSAAMTREAREWVGRRARSAAS